MYRATNFEDGFLVLFLFCIGKSCALTNGQLNMVNCRTNYYQQFDIYQVSVAFIWAWKITRKVLFLNREFDRKTTFSSIKFRMLAMVVLYIA